MLSLNVVKGCPEIPEETAVKLITMLEAKQLPELKSTTATSIKAISDVRQSWCSRLLDYVKIGNTECARRAIDKAEFLGYKAMVKNDLAIRQLRQGQWEVLKGLALNRRARKRLLRAASWIVRWDPPCVERRQDHLRHLGYVGDTVYLNVNTLLAENEFVDVWRVLWLAAIQGRIGAVVARDAADRPLDQLMVAPHRNKVHFLHAMSVAGRMVRGGEVVSLYVEDAAVSDPRTSTSTTTSAPWREQPDTKAYFSEMGIADAVVDSFSGEHAARRAEMDSDAAWKLHVLRNHTPYRKDCSVCVRNAATGRQHRASAHPSAYTLSLDIAGPIKGHGLSPDGKYFRFFVVGAFRIPVVEGGIGRDDDLRGHPLPDGDEEVQEELSDEELDALEAELEEEIPPGL